MGVIDAKEEIIAEEEGNLVPITRRVKLFARLIGQDVKSVQSALSWEQNASTPNTETEFKPFDSPKDDDLRKLYASNDLARYACEKMSRDIFQNGITIGKKPTNEKPDKVPQSEKEEPPKETEGDAEGRNKNILLVKQWQELPTPQNPDWGLRELFTRWITLERKWGWAGFAKHPNGAFFVFSTDEYQDKQENYHKADEKVESLQPFQFPCIFKLSSSEFKYTFKEEEVVILVTRPKSDDWRGYPLIQPIYSKIVYLTNIEWGIAQAYWSFGSGRYVLYHPQGTKLKQQSQKFGSARSRQTIHLSPLDHPNADPLNRLQNVGITTLHKMTEDLAKYYSACLAYLEIPETWYWGSGAGTNSTSYMNGIQYESTIQNEKDDIYSGVLKALNLAMDKGISEFQWNSGQMMDEMSKAEMLEGITFLTINEKRERYDDTLERKPEWDVIPDMETREFEVTSEPTDTTQTPNVGD